MSQQIILNKYFPILRKHKRGLISIMQLENALKTGNNGAKRFSLFVDNNSMFDV